MRVAICDDERTDAAKIEFALADLTQDMTIDYYASGKELLDNLTNVQPYDCIFMDIYMNEENGMDIARQVREITPETEIIFSTSSRDFAVDAFRVRAADYLVKPYSELDIVKAIARVKLNTEAKKPVVLRATGEMHAFVPDKVIRIESEKHYMKITMKDGKINRVHMNFSEVIDQFGENFIEIKRGLAVNMQAIKRIQGGAVILSDGESHVLSRGRKDEFIELYTKYVTEHQS